MLIMGKLPRVVLVGLLVLGHFVCAGFIFATAGTSVSYTEHALQGPFDTQGIGFGVAVPGIVGDSGPEPSVSTLEIWEDEKILGPAHSLHETIRNKGEGLYSHWGEYLYFSTSDNTDPAKNGRLYKVRIYEEKQQWAPLAGVLAVLFLIGALALWPVQQRNRIVAAYLSVSCLLLTYCWTFPVSEMRATPLVGARVENGSLMAGLPIPYHFEVSSRTSSRIVGLSDATDALHHSSLMIAQNQLTAKLHEEISNTKLGEGLLLNWRPGWPLALIISIGVNLAVLCYFLARREV